MYAIAQISFKKHLKKTHIFFLYEKLYFGLTVVNEA